MSEKRKKAYELAEERRRVSLSKDPIEEELEAEEEELAREARRLRLEEIVAKRRRRLQEAQGGLVVSNPTLNQGMTFATNFVAALIQDPNVQKQWLSLSDEDRAKIIQSVNMLMMSSGAAASSGSNIAVMLPFMMSALKSNPGMDAKGLVELIKTVSPPQQVDLKGIAELINATKTPVQQQPQTVESLFDKFVKPVMDELKATREELAKERLARLEKEIVELRSRPGFAEELARKKEELAMFREMFGGGESTDKEIELARLELEKWKTEKEWEMQKWQMEMGLKRESEKEKWDTVKKLLTPTLKRASPLIDAAINRGKQTLSTARVPRSPPQQAQNVFNCTKCGTSIPLEGPPFPDEITCPECGTKFAKEA